VSSKRSKAKSKTAKSQSMKHILRAFLLGGLMMAAALTGCMTPDQMDELMYAHNHQKAVMMISDESENGEDKNDNVNPGLTRRD
jgi:hypothetical protein